MRRARLSAILGAAALVSAAGTARAQSPRDDASGHVITTTDSVVYERMSEVRFVDGSPVERDDELDALTPEEELSMARAVAMLRTSRYAEGLAALDLLWRRHPASVRVAQAAASAYLRGQKPQEALRLLELTDKAIREARERGGVKVEKGAAPSDPLAGVRARALLALGRRKEAIPHMAAAAADPRGETLALRRQLLEWAETVDMGPAVVTAAERSADAAPRDVNRGLLAAEIECRAGKTVAAVTRLSRLEQATGSERPGELVRAVAERLLGERQGATLAAPLWLELARGPFAPDVRADALRRLMAPTFWMDEANGALTQTRAFPVPAADIAAAWRSLPGGEDRARVGLELLNALRARGERGLADRLAADLSRTEAPSSLAGPMDLEAGLLALSQGRLDEAAKRLARARAQASDDESRERAEYAQAEVLFFSAQFDTAQAAFDAFATAHPRSPLANDALERAYLLEGDGDRAPDQTPGLASLARGLYAEARRQWDEAAQEAHRADDEARVAQAPAPVIAADSESAKLQVPGARNPVRAHALLLLSRAEEARSSLDAARLAALVVADSLPGDRLAPLARKRAGDLEMAQGHREAALHHYEEMLARYPRSWLAAEVRREVTQLRADLAKGRTP